MDTTIGIATLIDYRNFGNRLQNFALQEAVRQIGDFDVRTIPNRQGTFNGLSSLRRKFEIARSEDPRILLKARLGSPTRRSVFHADPDCLQKFTERYIAQADEAFVDSASFRASASTYKTIIVGSDQVWNPKFGLAYGLDYLTFCPAEARVAYAASFGVPSIPKRLTKRYQSGLAGIPSLSVREDRAAEIVYEFTGRRVPVVLDPTMLIERKQWSALAHTPASLSDKGYLLEFLLGDDEAAGWGPAAKFARRSGLEVVNLGRGLVGELLSLSPFEFLGALRDAEMVVTDSFHAAVFCTIFQVPFVVKPRGNMGSRFETLFRKTGLKFDVLGEDQQLPAARETDWGCVQDRVLQERETSLEFLAEALSGR